MCIRDRVQNTTQALRDKYKAITYNRTDCQYLKEEHFTEAPQEMCIRDRRNDEYDEAYESNPVLAAIDERMSLTDIDFQIPSMANVAMEGASAGTTFEPEKEKTENADVAKMCIRDRSRCFYEVFAFFFLNFLKGHFIKLVFFHTKSQYPLVFIHKIKFIYPVHHLIPSVCS